MKARYKILLVGNVIFFLILILAAAFFKMYIKEATRNTGASGVLAVIILMQIGIFVYLIAVFVITLIAFWWSKVRGKLEFIAAAKIQLVIVFLLTVLLSVLS